MSLNKIQHAAPTSATATGSTSAIATITGVAGRTVYITDIAGSSDKAGALILVKDGSTVIWQLQIGTTPFSEKFESALSVTSGADVTVTVDGTSLCKANIGVFLQ